MHSLRAAVVAKFDSAGIFWQNIFILNKVRKKVNLVLLVPKFFGTGRARILLDLPMILCRTFVTSLELNLQKQNFYFILTVLHFWRTSMTSGKDEADLESLNKRRKESLVAGAFFQII
jgi:hypothetical protein